MIEYTGNLRRDFEKAAEMVKLEDRIPGYRQQIPGLRSSVRNPKRLTTGSLRKPIIKKMLLLGNCKTGLPTRRRFRIMMAAIPVHLYHRHR